ncbi:zinc ribbon domain-containing protein [Streptomyces sp. NPDC059629]|uniref:zinc ribbon domain-containing protein n=1 Tax=Streptomyces sp. NPDC059629 TaxID=3346889 RepID=UPI003682B385
MSAPKRHTEDTGHARYTYRLRVSSAARTAVLAEWDRCRWIWNECVAKSRAVHAHNKADPDDKLTCGPAQLDKMLTEARAKLPWLRQGASVPQQQIIRDFAESQSKAPHAQHGKKASAKRRPKFLAKTTMARKAADAAIGATKAALIEMGRKHGRDIRLVHPAHTTMDCASCGARTKHALPLSERTYTCTTCGVVSPRDRNSARVMPVRAGLNPAGAEGVSPPGALLPEAA